MSLEDGALGPATQQSGHRLKFQEFPFPQGAYPYCRVQQNGNPQYIWNPAVPLETLVITQTTLQFHDDLPAAATLGYVQPYWDRNAGRHILWINYYSLVTAGEMAYRFISHELGHDFGLYHEHQRPDRKPSSCLSEFLTDV
jgi:hypothetical protein